MKRDLVNNIGIEQGLAPAVKNTASETGDPISLRGFESATVVINTGAIAGDGDFSLKIQHSDTTTGGDFEDVPANRLIGELPETLEAGSTYRQGYIGMKGYIRLVLTRDSGTSIALGAVVIKGHPADMPVA
ncbi:MAG: hypothetical protein JJU15_00405 [Pararhodobacter sp.]|nr:hypothetical protein [Pararhodobacter sp.]